MDGFPTRIAWGATSSATSWETPTPAVTWTGRILIPQTLRAMFGLMEQKDIRFIGVGEYLELWNIEQYHGLTMTPNDEADRILDYIYDTYFKAPAGHEA